MAKSAELAVSVSTGASRGNSSASVEGAPSGGKSVTAVTSLATPGSSHLDSGLRLSVLGQEGQGRLLLTTSMSRARLASRLILDDSAGGGGFRMPPPMPRPDDEQRKRGITSLVLVRRHR